MAGASRHLVDRCPSCGVEHDAGGVRECEACGAALRLWCRAHSRETGWLSEPACARCAEEAARHAAPAPPPPREPAAARPAVAAPPAAAEVRPVPPRASPPAHVLFPGGPAPGRPLREVIGHGRPPAGPAGGGPENGSLIGGVLLVVLGTAVGGLLGVIGGMISVAATPGSAEELTTWAFGGAGVGLLAGLGIALAAVAQASRRG